MKGPDSRPRPIAALRRQAEEVIGQRKDGEEIAERQPSDIQAVLHELRVHQIELEIQNEELRDAQQMTEAAKAKAEEVRDRFMRLFHEAPVGYASVDQAGMIHSANQTLRDMTQLNPKISLNQTAFASLIHPDDEPIFRARFPAFFDKPNHKRIELRLRHAKETDLWVEITGRIVSWYSSRTSAPYVENQLLMIIHDLRERKKLEAELGLAAQVFEHSTEGIMITDSEGRILRVNHAFTVVTGYRQEEVLGKTPRILKSGRHPAGFFKNMWEMIATEGRWQGEIWNKRKNDEVYPEWLHISAVRNQSDKITNYISIFSDISEQKQAENQMERLAHFDSLTNLPNRVLFYDRLKQALIKSKRYETSLVVLMLDLDRFKAVNDNHGHAAGDILLQQVAQRLGRAVRASDTLARLGGDEFIILLADFQSTEQAAKSATKVAEQIIEALDEPMEIHDHLLTVTTSIGIAISPQDGATLDALVKHADAAMYNAKDKGRHNYQFYSAEIHARSQARSCMEQALHQAMQRGEFFLLYQPKVNLCAGRIVGVEALLRWRHNGEIIGPDHFIPVAEETGIILPLSEWVLNEACALAVRLANMVKSPFRVAINLSVRQLAAPQRLVDQISKALQSWNLNPAMLELEITETSVLKEAEGAAWALTRLKEMGLHISLDDFGTGYSSLTYLRRFPIDTLKIDRSFIRDIGRDSEDEAIVRSVIALAQSLGLDMVAEGIEHEIHRYFLLDNGCSTGQGFLFWKPIPGNEVETILHTTDQRWRELQLNPWPGLKPPTCL
ncbi:MAG TPA: hypothetical protein DEQ20_02500 [Desulfobulbaceae bacterium]|nr:MAG: hypothetical protein A2520_03545 [Deltaproteobacteria bacterium RIFOXYD12_FULL_53_23]HCC53784.1 hypothetical protein [Desulfobulbaceae bacterium]